VITLSTHAAGTVEHSDNIITIVAGTPPKNSEEFFDTLQGLQEAPQLWKGPLQDLQRLRQLWKVCRTPKIGKNASVLPGFDQKRRFFDVFKEAQDADRPSVSLESTASGLDGNFRITHGYFAPIRHTYQHCSGIRRDPR